MTHTDFFRAYLRHYAEKNLEAVSAMLAEEVHLRDWNISVHGKAESLRETAYLMRSPANARRLLDAMERLETGRGVHRELLETD